MSKVSQCVNAEPLGGVIAPESVKDRLVPLRGEWSLLDRDVAALCGVGTKEVNQAVRNSLRKETASLSSLKDWTAFTFGSDVIRFRTSPRLVRYTNVRKWDAGYLEVGADYGHGEEEEYIDLVPILENLYYDPEKFLKRIKNVEVVYG